MSWRRARPSGCGVSEGFAYAHRTVVEATSIELALLLIICLSSFIFTFLVPSGKGGVFDSVLLSKLLSTESALLKFI